MRKLFLLIFLLVCTGCDHLKEKNAQTRRAYEAEINARKAYEDDYRIRNYQLDEDDLAPVILWEWRF
jgi:hypothetical protein